VHEDKSAAEIETTTNDDQRRTIVLYEGGEGQPIGVAASLSGSRR
jgi:hypothetical protein